MRFVVIREMVGDLYARESGFNEVGELNDIIILYPQIAANLIAPINPLGCWDIYGYTGPEYGKKYMISFTHIATFFNLVAFYFSHN